MVSHKPDNVSTVMILLVVDLYSPWPICVLPVPEI